MLSFKVSEKGAVSVYGMGRFPTTLYAEQWAKLLAPEVVTELQAFIEANRAKLATKAVKAATADKAPTPANPYGD